MANHLPQALQAVPFCPDCGANRLPESRFCPHCGCSFTGLLRAKGAPPSIPPVTRPLLPAVRGLDPSAPLDIEAIEGIERFFVLPLPRRPRTAVAANADEPDVLHGREAPLGLGVTSLALSIVTDASRADDPAFLAGENAPRSPLAPMSLHVVSEGMARVDDIEVLAIAPRGGLGVQPSPATARAVAVSPPPPQGGSRGPLDVMASELASIGMSTTSTSGLADDPGALAQGAPFVIGLGVTHLGQVLAQVSLVDDPIALAGGALHATSIPRAVLHEMFGFASRVDEPQVLAPVRAAAAPPLAASAANLASDWADVAERPMARKDDRSNVVQVPRHREVVFSEPDRSTPSAPPTEPEPLFQYVPAAPAGDPASRPPPWAALVGAIPASTAAPQDPPTKRPGAATMMMNLDQDALRALAERLVQKGAVTAEDLDQAKKKT